MQCKLGHASQEERSAEDVGGKEVTFTPTVIFKRSVQYRPLESAVK